MYYCLLFDSDNQLTCALVVAYTVYFLLRQAMSKKENHATVTIPSGRPEESAVQELPAQAEPVQETPSQEE